MRAGSLFGIAAFAATLASAPLPSLAQDTAPPATNTPAETIGPRELQDFTLNGTVTRPAGTAPVRTLPSPRPATPRASPRGETAAQPPLERPAREPAPQPIQSLPAPDPLATAPTPAPADLGSPLEPQPGFAPGPAPAQGTRRDQPGNNLPWLFALVLLASGAGYYAWRQRSRPSYAGGARLSDALVAAEPLAAPPPAPLQRAPPPRPSSPSGPAGIVSTRLRPWLEIEFAPSRCVVDDDKATIQFDVAVFNSGSAPARDVLVEASMFNAGPSQEQQIGAFFEYPVGKGDRIPAIPPLKRVALKSSVSLARDQLRSFEVGGRHLFVPLIGFNALYRWSGGEGQTSASYLVGRDTDSEKMAPLRLDLGPRVFRNLGARGHSLRVRK